jgi:hypothetical protein
MVNAQMVRLSIYSDYWAAIALKKVRVELDLMT